MGTASENISHLDEAWGCGPHKIPFLGSPDHKLSWKVQDVGLAIKARYPGTLTSPPIQSPHFQLWFLLLPDYHTVPEASFIPPPHFP